MTDNAEIATTETHSHLMATAQIVAAAITGGRLELTDDLIKTVRKALVAPLVEPEPEPKPRKESVVSARQSVREDAVTCMDCGFVGKSLKRHLRTAHGQTPEQYREHWALKPDHPIVAPSYAAMRSQLAKANGLGRKVTP